MAGPRVLLITSRYFLCGEVMRAFDRLGVEYDYLDTGGDEVALDDHLPRLVRSLKTLRPHFALTVNHLGVDHEGLLTGLLSRMDIPLASWFVDNPYLALAIYRRPAAKRTAMFTWDADNLEPLRRSGFTNVYYLPLATDEQRFAPGRHEGRDRPWRARVSFVGNSMVIKTALRLEYSRPTPGLLGAFAELAEGFGDHPAWSVRAYLAEYRPDLTEEFAALGNASRQLAFETAVIWESTRRYRRRCLRELMPFSPLIVGDEGWLATFQGHEDEFTRLPELSYYEQLPDFYPLSDVNFNCTSLQMKGAVNQRVFDVPACGAFLLTDRRAQMEALFEPGKEMAVYDHPGEIVDLTRHYLAHPEERTRMAKAARRRVLAEHTYTTRMSQLLDVMRRDFS
ncbi:hypothetical protein JCM15519_09610 [Fundidesulfovibrio butyratiphilus]